LRASLEEEGRGEGERGKEKEKAAIQRVLSNPMNSQCLLIISIIVRPSHRQEHVKTTTTTTTEVIIHPEQPKPRIASIGLGGTLQHNNV